MESFICLACACRRKVHYHGYPQPFGRYRHAFRRTLGRSRTILILGLMLAACSDGSNGAAGATGPAGPARNTGAGGSGRIARRHSGDVG